MMSCQRRLDSLIQVETARSRVNLPSLSKMKFDLHRPCNLCPFVRGGLGLDRERARALGGQIVDINGDGGRGVFVCHKTGITRGSGAIVEKLDGSSQHCAGALIFAEKQNAPTQMMRIAERLRLYDRHKLDKKSFKKVFDNLAEMISSSWPLAVKKKR